ncbi:hypothetical protein DITRI_Ditri11bG0115000 [Diplodiscus trichospermus]
MVGRESKGGCVFSWADEVEKEEEEEAAATDAGNDQTQAQQKQNPNPFGSARPREVVLQEKGIDYRKLDLHLQQPSHLRHESRNEKLRKESNVQPTTTILNSKQSVRFRGSPIVSSQPHVIFTPQIQSPILFVPPLRYPPKYVAGFLYKPGVSTTPKALDIGYQHSKLEKENRSHGGRKILNLKSESTRCGNTKRVMTELVQAKEAQRKGRILGESVLHGNKPENVSATRKGKIHGSNSLGFPLVNQNIGQPEMQGRRMPANGRQQQDDLVMEGTENNEAMEHKWQKVNRKPQDSSVKQVNNGGRNTAHRMIKADRAGLGRGNNKNNFQKGLGRGNSKYNFQKKENKLHTEN